MVDVEMGRKRDRTAAACGFGSSEVVEGGVWVMKREKWEEDCQGIALRDGDCVSGREVR